MNPWGFQQWAFDTQTGNPARKAVLSMLAMMADSETGRCEAKQCTLAHGAEISERAVRGHLKALEEAGLIARRPQFRRDRGRRGDEFLLLAPGVVEWPDGEPINVQPADFSGGSTNAERPHPPEAEFLPPRKPASAQEQPPKELAASEPVNARARDTERVWEHWQSVMPNGSRYSLDTARRRVIKNALDVRSADECCAAIDGLAKSEYHREHGFLDVKYALLGGGRTPSPDATIDKWIAESVAGSRNGNGHAGRSGTVGNARFAQYDVGIRRDEPEDG